MNQTKKNISYNILYQIVVLLIPLITAPYLSRVLGTEGIGAYTYTNSFSNYFVLFSLLGLSNYGNRVIAQTRDNKKRLSKVFSEIYSMQIITSFVAVFIYLGLINLIGTEYKLLFAIQMCFVISALFDVSWFYYGIEDFKRVLTRNLVLRVFMLLGIFILVKQPTDLWKYTLIMSAGTLLSQIYLWFELRKRVKYSAPKLRCVLKHFRPNIILFIPVIAVSLYHTMDKVMLGWLSSMHETGIYENADKIVTIPLTLITAVGTVMMPKMSNLFANKDMPLIMVYIRDSMQLISGLAIGMAFGLAAIAEKFAPLYFGISFIECGKLIKFLVPTMVFASIASVIRTQYLIPREKDVSYLISVIAGAIINLIVNGLLINKFGAVGAVIGTVIAELTVMTIQVLAVRKELPILTYIKDMFPFLLSGIIMFFMVSYFGSITGDNFIGVFLDIMIGIIVYGGTVGLLLKIINKKRFEYLITNIKSKR